MLELLITPEALAGLPEAIQKLYTEQGDGQYSLTQIKGLKTQGDVDRVMTSLTAERNAHKETKAKIKAWEGLEPDKVRAELAKIEEYKVLAEQGGGDVEERVQKLLDAKLASVTGPLEHQIKTANEKVAELTISNEQLVLERNTRTIEDNAREVITNNKIGKVVDSAMPDILMNARAMLTIDEQGNVVTRDQVGVTPGVPADIWFKEMVEKRNHWLQPSEGGGTGGGKNKAGGGANPWKKDSWNIAAQGAYVKEHGADAAASAAKAAGSALGATAPPQ